MIGLLVVLGGCGRPTTVSPSRTESLATGRETSLAATNAPAGPSEAEIEAMLADLTQMVRRYGMEQQQAPATLQDLVAKGYLSGIPPAPAGKKFAINQKLEVYLAKP
jgi:hypothetical protein